MQVVLILACGSVLESLLQCRTRCAAPPLPAKKLQEHFFFCIAHLRVQGNFYTVGTWPLVKDFFLRPSHIQQTCISQQAIYFCSYPCRNPGSAWFLFAKHIDLHFCITFSTVIISLKVVFIVPYAIRPEMYFSMPKWNAPSSSLIPLRSPCLMPHWAQLSHAHNLTCTKPCLYIRNTR